MSGAILFSGARTPFDDLAIPLMPFCMSPMGMRNSPSATPVAEEVIESCRLLWAKRKTYARTDFFSL